MCGGRDRRATTSLEGGLRAPDRAPAAARVRRCGCGGESGSARSPTRGRLAYQPFVPRGDVPLVGEVDQHAGEELQSVSGLQCPRWAPPIGRSGT